MISYPWASNMVYRIAGEAPPVPQRAGGIQGAPPPGVRVRPNTGGPEAARRPAPPPALHTDGIDELWARAEQQVPEWRSISLRLPTSPDMPVTFTIDEGTGGQPQRRATLTLNRSTDEVVHWEPFSSLSTGRQLRSWLRFSHTGEIYGLVGQTIAGLVSLGGAVLVFTGLALALRRFVAWRTRLRKAAPERRRFGGAHLPRLEGATDNRAEGIGLR